MKKNVMIIWTFHIFLLSLFLIGSTSQNVSLEIILKKNIEASGGLEFIKKISSVSYELIGTQSPGSKPRKYLIGVKDKIKVLEGTPPLIDKAIVLNDNRILIDSADGSITPDNINKMELYCFSRLINGNFSLYNFSGILEKIGLKKTGDFESYVLRTKYNSSDILFYLDSTTFLLTQMIIEQQSGSSMSFKTIYDFYPKGDVNGYMIPTGFYKSEIGNENSLNYGYGDEYLFRNFKQNEKFADDEFDKALLNFGEVSFSDKKVNGNVIAASYNGQVKRGVFYTNIKADVLEKAGIKEKDILNFEIGDKKFQSVYIKSQINITPELSQPGKVIVSTSARTPFHIVLFYGDDFKDMVANTSLLTKINIFKE